MRSAILFILLCPCLTAQETAGITGTAIDAITRSPMAGVHISMRVIAEPSDVAYGAISGHDGHFSIARMPPGIYYLGAQHNGYVYPPADDGVTLKPGALTEFTVEMTPRASISGRVVDEYGDPVQRVDVTAVPAASGSRVGASAMVNMHTDERGQFRLTGAPGKYYVRTFATRGTAFGMTEINTDGLGPASYGATWYPGSESKDRASVVEVAAGHDLNGIDIHLARKRTLTISGTVTGIPEIPGFVRVLLLSDEGGTQEVGAAPGGKFTAPGLTPGHYRILANRESGDGPLRSRFVDVQLDNADKSGVSLTLEKGDALTGTLEIAGAAATAEKRTVRLESLSTHEGFDPTSPPKGGEVDREGAFRIERVFADKFRVRVLPMPENGFVKSVKLDNVETKDDVLDLSRGVGGARIKVTVSRSGGQVEGGVLGEDGGPLHMPFAFVVLAATAEEIDGGRLKPVESGAKFKYSGLRPGKYRLIGIDPRQFDGDLDGIKAMFPKALEIEIHEGDRITKDVKIVAAENAAENAGAKP